MRIFNSQKFAETFGDLYDWVDDDTVEVLQEYENNDREAIDFDALEQGLPVVNMGDEEINKVLVDNIEEPETIEPLTEESEVSKDEEIAIEGKDVRKFKNTQEAMEWAIKNNRVVKIFYTTKGRGSRNEKKYLKREKGLSRTPTGGVNIYRTIEPYYIYNAGNGNTILVTYDRSVGRGFIGKRKINDNIRSFIVDNITAYNFTKNRKTKKPQHFKPKFKIIPKSNKKVDTMENNNIIDNFEEIIAMLTAKGMVKSATVTREAKKSFNNLKIAQYVGVQGYWIRNKRCWDNCYRQKRVAQPNSAAQEVWTECWEEYNKSINDDKSGWEKYASVKKANDDDWNINDPKEREKHCPACGSELEGGECLKRNCPRNSREHVFTSTRDKNIKISEQNLNKIFISKVSEKIEDGSSTPEAIYATIEEESQVEIDKMLESSSKIMEIADTLHSNGMKEMGDKMAELSANMLKEAGVGDFWNSLKDMWKKKPQEPQKEDPIKTIIKNLRQIEILATNVLRSITRQYQFSSSRKIIVEAGRGSKIITAAAPGETGALPIDNIAPEGTFYGDDPLNSEPGSLNSEDTNPGAPIEPQPAQSNMFKNFRIVLNSVNSLLGDMTEMYHQIPTNSTASQYLNAALTNLEDFVSKSYYQINNKTLKSNTVGPLLQDLIKVTRSATRGLQDSMSDQVAPSFTPETNRGNAPSGSSAQQANTSGVPAQQANNSGVPAQQTSISGNPSQQSNTSGVPTPVNFNNINIESIIESIKDTAYLTKLQHKIEEQLRLLEPKIQQN